MDVKCCAHIALTTKGMLFCVAAWFWELSLPAASILSFELVQVGRSLLAVFCFGFSFMVLGTFVILAG